MKILHVVWRQRIGGAELFALNIAQRQSSQNNVYIYYLGAKHSELTDVVGLNVIAGNLKSGFDFIGLMKFAKFLKINKFDIVHHHQNLSAVMVNLLFSNGSKIIKHEHGTTESTWKTYRERILSSFVKHSVALYIANSHHTKQQLIKFENIRADKIQIIPCGIDISRFSSERQTTLSLRSELNLSNKVKIVGFVGRLVWEKGVDDFIRMAGVLRKMECNVHFIIAGEGPMREEFEKLTQQEGLFDVFNYIGARQDIEIVYKACDVMCFTSRKEAQGLAVIEAMASGVPVVAFSVGGIPEVVENAGQLVQDRNIDEMASVVKGLLENNDTSYALKVSGIRKSKNYDIKTINRQILELYSNVLKKL